MSTHSPFIIAGRPARAAARVTVAVIAGPSTSLVATPEQLGLWWCLTPRARWSTLSVRSTHPDAVLHGVISLLGRHDVVPDRLILVAEGEAARAALELVLRGAIDCAGLLAIAIPCTALPFRIVPTTAAIRLVVGRQDRKDMPVDLISELHAADIDTRIIGFASGAANNARAAASAAETFVLELVANASRQHHHHGV